MPESKIITIGTGEMGGKGHGFSHLKKLLSDLARIPENKIFTDSIRVPKTFSVTTSVFSDFIKFNKFENLIEDAKSGGKENYEVIKDKILAGKFSDDVKKELFGILKQVNSPLAIRSSSLLEDQKGASFAGKYESVFDGNQGTEEVRQEEFLKAIKTVYASTYNPSAIAYRKKHGFLEDNEEMALLVQEVVGRRYGEYYLPALAGVGFSQNGYCWNKEINKKDGLVRLVFGLGTRAVGRGYVCLFSPVKPLMRPEGTEANIIQKCSQKKVDVIDLRNNTIKTVHFRELISDGFNCYPGSQAMVSLRDGNYLYRPVSNLWDAQHIPVLTMNGVLSGPWLGIDLSQTIGWLLKRSEEDLGHAVDIEFAVKIDPETGKAELFLLQARALSESEERKARPIPKLDPKDVIFTVRRNLPTAYVPDIEFLVYVDEMEYRNWPHKDKQSVARVIGKVNEVLQGKRFALIGPGRWGSWNPDLGVPVTYAEIFHCIILVEVARRRATYVPEVSFGSHFFQDLIEDNIAYLPVYPDEPGAVFNEEIFSKQSEFSKLLPDEYYRKFDKLIKVVHIPNVADNRKAHAILNGELEKAAMFLK